MNEAQSFIIFFSILAFGWIGFFAGKGWEDHDERNWHFSAYFGFMFGSAAMFITAAINLGRLLVKNF